MIESGFGLLTPKQEGMSIDTSYGMIWNGHIPQMEKRYAEKYNKWYYWPIKKLIRSVFVYAWRAGLREEAYSKLK